jgi:Mor family transcriptional regulator
LFHPVKLTEDKVREMREAYATGEANLTELAKKYGISIAHTGRIMRGFSWKGKARLTCPHCHTVILRF